MTTPAELDEFFAAHDYTGSRTHDAAELAAVRALRAPLRRLLTSDRDEAVRIVNEILAERHAVPALVRHDGWDYHLHAIDAGAPLADRIAVETDPVGQRCAGVDRVQVVVPAVVPHQRGDSVPLGQNLVDDPYRLVPVAGQQPPQRGAQRAHRGQLGGVVGPGPGVVVRSEELVELVRSRHRVRRLRRVHQRDRGLQRRGGVMSEDHIDTLHPNALVSGVMAVLAHDTPSTTRAGTRLASGLGLAVLSASSFGLSGSVARGLMDAGWSSAAAVVVRILLAAAVLVPIALVQLRGRWRLLVRNLRLVAGYGLVAVAGCQLAYFNAVAHMQVGVALLIEYTAPVAVVGWLWLRRGQRPGRLTVLGVLLGAAGLVL